MRTSRRLAALALVATAGLALPACSSTVHAAGSPAPTAQETAQGTAQGAADETPAPPVEEAGDTGTVPSGSTGSGGDDLPEPGAGVPGDEGLCQAVVGWFGYASLALLATDDDGRVSPDDVVPLLEGLRAAPRDHRDADADLLALAADVSTAAGDAVDQVRSGTDLYTAIAGLEQPVTAFADGCTAAGVSC